MADTNKSSASAETKQYRDDVTEEMFNKAADQLAAEGKKVTISNIRELIGGSPYTLMKFKNAYDRRVLMSKFSESMPKSFQDAAIAAITDLYGEFEKRTNTMRKELIDKYDAQNEELALMTEKAEKAAQAKVDAAEAELKALRSKSKQLQERCASLEKRNEELTAALNASKEQAQTAEASNRTLMATQQQILSQLQLLTAKSEGQQSVKAKEVNC